MKKVIALFMALIFVLNLSACVATQLGDSGEEPFQGSTWREQYDLGVRYLSEGNYQEAILAFTAAIEIDPKQAPAYVGRGDAYVLSGETEVNLSAAKTDYEKAIKLDGTSAEAYLGLADVYIRQGDYAKARETLNQGIEMTGGNSEVVRKLIELENNKAYNEYGATEFTHRSNYHTFESLSEAQQLLIIEMAECAQLGDYDALLQIADKSVDESSGGFTSWNGYKIEYILPNQHDTDGISLRSYQIILRPENGMGYELYVWSSTSDVSGGIENNISISSCPCANWQWDGAYQYRWTVDAVYGNLSYPQSEMHHVYTETGKYVNGLRNGEFNIIYHQFWDYRKRPAVEREDEEVYVYNMGICVQHNGESVDNNPESISWNGGKVQGSFEDQWVLDTLYW